MKDPIFFITLESFFIRCCVTLPSKYSPDAIWLIGIVAIYEYFYDGFFIIFLFLSRFSLVFNQALYALVETQHFAPLLTGYLLSSLTKQYFTSDVSQSRSLLFLAFHSPFFIPHSPVGAGVGYHSVRLS